MAIPVAAARSIGMINCSAARQSSSGSVKNAAVRKSQFMPGTACHVLGGRRLRAKARARKIRRWRHSQIQSHLPAGGVPRQQVSLHFAVPYHGDEENPDVLMSI